MNRIMHYCKLSVLALILPLCFAGKLVAPLEAQIMIQHGDLGSPDSYECDLSGLKGMGSDCGTRDDAMVFTAEILSIAPAPNYEYRLALRPLTIFKGTPEVGIEIMTAQRNCLPKIKIGDSWLFSLYRDPESKELIVNYGSHSGPVDQEGARIEFLRRLASLDHEGVVKGYAYSYRETNEGAQEPIPLRNHTVILTRIEDGQKLKTLTDAKGNFEFKPVAAGKYDLDSNTTPGLWTEWSGPINVEAQGCTYFDLDFQLDGQIAGKLVFPAGIDPFEWEVEASPVDDPGDGSVIDWTDHSGEFVLHGLRPGKYLVKFGKTEMREGPNLKVDLYAPGTPERNNAQVIELGKASRFEGIEIVVPRAAIE